MEDREAAKIAARKAGVPIGVWLSEQIRHASEDPSLDRQSDRRHSVDKQSDAAFNDDRQQGQTSRHSAHTPQDHHFGDHPPDSRWRNGSVDSRFAFGRGQWSVADQPVGNGTVANTSAGYPSQFRNFENSPQTISAAPSAGQPVPQSAGYRFLMPHPKQMSAPVPQQPAGMSLEKAEALEKRFDSFEERLQELHQRINRVEEKTLARFKPVLTKIEALTVEINKIVSNPAMIAERKGSFTTAPLERAVMRLSERVGRVEQTVVPGSRRGRGFFSRLFRRR